MLAKIQSRTDVVLYIIGGLLILSIFGGCTQKAPPLPAKTIAQQQVEAKPADDQPTDPNANNSNGGETPDQPATEKPTIKEGVLVYKVDSKQAKVLYQYLASAKKTNEDGSATRNGKNYSCTESKNKDHYTCQFTIVVNDGSIKDSNEVDQADAEVKNPVNYDDAFLQITVDNTAGRDTHLDLSVEASKLLFSEMKEFRDENGAKEGKHLRCVPKTDQAEEACRLWFYSATGEVAIVQ